MYPLMILSLFFPCLPPVRLMDQKALDEFVKHPDLHYKYTTLQRKVIQLDSPFHLDTINMTSQKWLDETKVDKPIWSHELKIVYPQRRKIGESCLLIIISEQDETDYFQPINQLMFNDLFQNLPSDRELADLASRIDSMVSMIFLSFRFVLNTVGDNIAGYDNMANSWRRFIDDSSAPPEWLVFQKHPLGRKNTTGYDLLAYSWQRFLSDSSAGPEWLLQFPMVKATVRAMDTIQDYMMKTYQKKITKFTLTSTGMTGWATWLTAAVDKRVTAIAPVAMDLLNFTKNFIHQYRAYCGWSYRLKPLYDMNIFEKLDNPRFRQLASNVDPMAYNERYKNITKLMFVLSGDEVFQPDNSHYYFDQLEGPKYLHIIPNADYRSQDKKKKILFNSITTFQNHIATNRSLPIVSWNRTMTNTTGIISLYACPDPIEVFCYHADTVDDTRRDFRMKVAFGNSSRDNPVKWTKSKAEKVKPGTYKKELEIPAKGWRGFFLQAIFLQDSSCCKLTLTSELHIIPDTFPCPDCSGVGCRGTLV